MLSPSEFLKEWNAEITGNLWIIRICALILMVVAFEMIVQPLSVAADLLRTLNYCTCCLGTFLDDAAQCVIHTVAFVAALALFSITVAVAWIAARPLLGIGLLVVAVGAICFLIHTHRKHGSARQVGISDVENRGMEAARAPMVQQMPQPVMAYAIPQPQMMQVAVPEGIMPGGIIQVQAPGGQTFNVQVPEGVFPGQAFPVQIPA